MSDAFSWRDSYLINLKNSRNNPDAELDHTSVKKRGTYRVSQNIVETFRMCVCAEEIFNKNSDTERNRYVTFSQLIAVK